MFPTRYARSVQRRFSGVDPLGMSRPTRSSRSPASPAAAARAARVPGAKALSTPIPAPRSKRAAEADAARPAQRPGNAQSPSPRRFRDAHTRARQVLVAAIEDDRAHRPFRFERRREERLPVQADEPTTRLVATYSDHGSRFGIAHLEVVDRSAAGLGVRTTTHIEPGMTVMLCPPGSRVPWAGAVAVRCNPDTDGEHFRVGLRLSAGRVAA